MTPLKTQGFCLNFIVIHSFVYEFVKLTSNDSNLFNYKQGDKFGEFERYVQKTTGGHWDWTTGHAKLWIRASKGL